MLVLILWIAAFVLFALAAFNVPSKWNLGWLGAACATLAYLIAHWK